MALVSVHLFLSRQRQITNEYLWIVFRILVKREELIILDYYLPGFSPLIGIQGNCIEEIPAKVIDVEGT